MESKKLQKITRVAKAGAIVGGVLAILSFVVPVVPCSEEALCSLPNPLSNLVATTAKYYWVNNNPITGLVLQFLVPAIIVAIILLLIKKKPKRVLDLTRK